MEGLNCKNCLSGFSLGSLVCKSVQTDTCPVVSVKPGRLATLTDSHTLKKTKLKVQQKKENSPENLACCLLLEPQ